MPSATMVSAGIVFSYHIVFLYWTPLNNVTIILACSTLYSKANCPPPNTPNEDMMKQCDILSIVCLFVFLWCRPSLETESAVSHDLLPPALPYIKTLNRKLTASY